MFLIFLGFLGLLVLIHMARPRFLRRELSSARFFKHLPQPKQTKSQLRVGKPPLTRSFIMQLLVLLLLITALFLSQKTFESTKTREWGLWFMVDTSASMTTLQKGKTPDSGCSKGNRPGPGPGKKNCRIPGCLLQIICL